MKQTESAAATPQKMIPAGTGNAPPEGITPPEETGQAAGAEEGPIPVTLFPVDGSVREATLLACFNAGAFQREYCAVLSHEPDEAGEYPILIFRCALAARDGTEGIEISEIGSDMEYEEARDALAALIGEDEERRWDST